MRLERMPVLRGDIMLHQIVGLERGHGRAVAAVAEEGVTHMERGL